jgi:hypothetical protein
MAVNRHNPPHDDARATDPYHFLRHHSELAQELARSFFLNTFY